MSGLIRVSEADGAYWSAAGWLFRWVLGVVTREMSDPGVKASIAEIVENNFGGFYLQEYTKGQQEEIRRVVREELMPVSRKELPADMPSRDAVLGHIQELVDLFPDSPIG